MPTHPDEFDAQKGKCFYCDEDMGDDISRDHLYPLSLLKEYGWQLHQINGNKVLSHRLCNQKKGNRLPTLEEVAKYMRIYKKRPKPFNLFGVMNEKESDDISRHNQ